MDEFAVSCDIRLYQSNTTYHFCNVLLKSLLASVFIFTIVFCCFGLLLVLEQGVPAFEDTEEGLLNHDPDLPDHVLLEGHEKQEEFCRHEPIASEMSSQGAGALKGLGLTSYESRNHQKMTQSRT